MAGTAAAASYGAAHWLPQGRTQELAERWVTAPGQNLYSRFQGGDQAQKKLEAGQEQLTKAGLDLKKLQDSPLGRELLKAKDKAKAEAQRLTRLYNVGAWAGTGFIVCLVLTLLFGVSSIKSALVLGFKVTLTLVFLQGALILGGVLVLQKLG